MIKGLRIGLKLWSTNHYYLRPAEELFREGYFDYIELYSQPGSYRDNIGNWKRLAIPYNIHAPHFAEGMNLAKKESERNNRVLAEEALRFADDLKAAKVIIHPGVEGDTAETIRQLKLIGDKRLIVENKPYYSVDGKHICNGHSPEEIKRIMEDTGLGFCLDFGHAICSANAKEADPVVYIKSFLGLKPVLYHLTDGAMESPYDGHLHYGQGSYPLKELFAMVPPGSDVTNEASKESKTSLDDFRRDMEFLKSL